MICKIEMCQEPAAARGWCRKHYMRWWAHGDPHTCLIRKAPKGAPLRFMEAALLYDAEPCLIWPFATNGIGYAQINIDGRKYLVHRLVCGRAHGPAPAAGMDAAHSCGNGHLGCIAPPHLRWATRLDNCEDTITHGRSTRGQSRARVPLTREQAVALYVRAHSGESQSRLAKEFGISQPAVSLIKNGKNWGWLTAGKADAA